MSDFTYEYAKVKHEETRKQVWLHAWANTASAVTCNKKETATAWADYALKTFDERFPDPVPPPESWNHPLVD
jgi:hypothetical protein